MVVIFWVLQLKVVSLSGDHEQMFEVFLLNVERLVELIDSLCTLLGEVLLLVAEQFEVLCIKID